MVHNFLLGSQRFSSQPSGDSHMASHHFICRNWETRNVCFSMKTEYLFQQILKRKPRLQGKWAVLVFLFFFFHKSVKYQYPSDFHTLKLWGVKGWLWTRSSRQPGLCSSPKLGHKAQNNHSESSKSCWGWSKLPLSNAIWTTVGYFLF